MPLASSLTNHAFCLMSDASYLTPHASCLLHHATGFMSSSSCLTPHASFLLPHSSCLMCDPHISYSSARSSHATPRCFHWPKRWNSRCPPSGTAAALACWKFYAACALPSYLPVSILGTYKRPVP